jgi:HK97 gp10 family phage protein
MQIKVSGLKEVEAQLIKLGSVEGTKVLRAAMLRATKPIETQAKANAGAIQKGSGALQRSIGRRFVIGNNLRAFFLPPLGGKFTVLIAPIKSNRVAIALYNLFYGRKRKGLFHGHLVEFGTQRSRAQPFLLPALHARASEAVQSLASEIERGIAALLSRK